MTDPTPVPERAITAALKAAPDQHIGLGHWEPIMSRADMRRTLEAAAPAIREAERQRLANRTAMVDEVKAELDDAFQFTRSSDGARHGYVTRAWVEALLATHAASAAEAERERIAKLASERQAFYLVTDCQPGECPAAGQPHAHGFADLIGDAHG